MLPIRRLRAAVLARANAIQKCVACACSVGPEESKPLGYLLVEEEEEAVCYRDDRGSTGRGMRLCCVVSVVWYREREGDGSIGATQYMYM